MIRITRGAEPKQLEDVRARELPKLKQLAKARPITSHDIEGYQCVAEVLRARQHFKCCYCEAVLSAKYNDVEHFRPKAEANRKPGASATHGYWWLAFHWENLLFACPTCNRSAKNSAFPLAPGSVILAEGQDPPGQELPLLLDPAGQESASEHIRFERSTNNGTETWWPIPHQGSQRGEYSIHCFGIGRHDLQELRLRHLPRIQQQVEDLNAALRRDDPEQVQKHFERTLALLEPQSDYVLFTWCVVQKLVDHHALDEWGYSPFPTLVALNL